MSNLLKSLKQGILYPKHYIEGQIKSTTSVDSIAPNHGAVIDDDGKKVAVYKDGSGAISAHSAVCTHLGCIVGWEENSKEWHCPCHGSKYDKDGKVVHGPAKHNLPAVELTHKT